MAVITTTACSSSIITSVNQVESQAVEAAKEEEGLVVEERWATHYSSLDHILLVGDGDFSFSLSLATSFGSASNIVATSLDAQDVVIAKYGKAKSNLENLKKLGAAILHGVDATKMKFHTDLMMRKFDRIIFNFPHAGFHGKEDHMRQIRLHKNLVRGFFKCASGMLRPSGEVHVRHKTSRPYCSWNLEELASKYSFALVEFVNFEIKDYPGYNNKRGDGLRCDEPFHLGDCGTFKFSIRNTRKGRKRPEPKTGHVMPETPYGHGDVMCSRYVRKTSNHIVFDGNNRLLCHPETKDAANLHAISQTQRRNLRILTGNDHSPVRYQQAHHAAAFPEMCRIGNELGDMNNHSQTEGGNLRILTGNDHSLVGYQQAHHASAFPEMCRIGNMNYHPQTQGRNLRIFSGNDHSLAGYQEAHHAAAFPELCRIGSELGNMNYHSHTQDRNLRILSGNDHSLVGYQQAHHAAAFPEMCRIGTQPQSGYPLRNSTVPPPIVTKYRQTYMINEERGSIFDGYFKHDTDMFGRVDYDFRDAARNFLTDGYEMYMNDHPGRTVHSYMEYLEQLHHLTILRSAELRRKLLSCPNP